jgi:glycosyltransferase involved in cell wall biosynthesis
MNIKLNITHIISSIDSDSGGPSRSVTDLCVGLSEANCNCLLLANRSPNPVAIKINPYCTVKFAEKGSYNPLSFSLKRQILENIPDLFHGHGLWQTPTHTMARIAREKSIPYVISPRGMLEPWALNKGKWKKKLGMGFYQRKDLSKAACIHATSNMEAENIKNLGFKNPVAIIPNGINLDEFPLKKTKSSHQKHTLLFLSRLHPKKGIELLIEAWSQLSESIRTGWQVDIAGNGDDQYISFLSKQIKDKGLSEEIRIIGPLFGKAKQTAYQRADLFVLPTYSENFGIVIAEALASGVPVITTHGAPWEELTTCNAGWWIEIGVSPLVECLKNALCKNSQDLAQMGLNGRNLIEKKYHIELVAKKMIELYRWVIAGGEKPAFVN